MSALELGEEVDGDDAAEAAREHAEGHRAAAHRRERAQALAEALRRNASLLQLSLENNLVGDEGARVLVGEVDERRHRAGLEEHRGAVGVASGDGNVQAGPAVAGAGGLWRGVARLAEEQEGVHDGRDGNVEEDERAAYVEGDEEDARPRRSHRDEAVADHKPVIDDYSSCLIATNRTHAFKNPSQTKIVFLASPSKTSNRLSFWYPHTVRYTAEHEIVYLSQILNRIFDYSFY